MASFKQTLHLINSLWKLDFLTYIIEIHTLIAIISTSSMRTILKLLGQIGQIESFLLPDFSVEQWSSNDTNKSIALWPRIWWHRTNLNIFFKQTLKIIGFLLTASLANSDVSFSTNKSQCCNRRHTSSVYNQSC